ncbi:MAG: crossover junction endodeoxyribonuclease [Pseudomonadota bacterium]
MSEKMKLGIDPGMSGAVALIAGQRVVHLIDMPVMVLGKSRRQVNAAELAKTIKGWRSAIAADGSEVTAYLERVAARPGQGVAGMFNFGVSYGVVQGILGALEVPVVLVAPAVWKKRAGLSGAVKDMARTVAQRLYPVADLARKKDVGRADALLIAYFGDLQ